MKMRRPALGSVAKYPIIALTSAVSLWPLTRINPLADDLHLLAQGSGMMRQEGFSTVLKTWTEFDLSSAHLTPIGGFLTTVQVWVANQLALRTPLSINDAWGLLRLAWLVGVILACVWCAGRFARFLSTSTPGPYLLAAVLLATLQVHGYWSNDPVVSFPVASWAFCIIGLLYLGALVSHLESMSIHRKKWATLICVLALAGTLTYELFLSFVCAATVIYIGLVLTKRISFRELFPVAMFGVIVPGAFIVASQIARLSQGSNYSGTALSVNNGNVLVVAIVALLSSLPLASTHLTVNLLPRVEFSISTFLFLFAGIVVLILASHLLDKRTEVSSVAPQKDARTIILGLFTLWLSSTMIIVATPKYQGELGGVLGRVYLNYGPAWIALSMSIAIVLAASSFVRTRSRLQVGALSVVVLFGAVNSWANSQHVHILANDTSWSGPMLVDLESRPEANDNRCQNVDRLFTLPWPPYYQAEILEGLQLSYSGTWGVPYCNFGSSDAIFRPLVRPLLGTFPVEYLPDGRRILWSTGARVELQLINPTATQVRGTVAMKFSLAPCADRMEISLSIGESNLLQTLVRDRRDWSVAFDVVLNPNIPTDLIVEQKGTGCRVETDPRELWTMIELPTIYSREK